MVQTTVLHDQHQQLGALLVDFAGWDMPLHYGSQLNEHHFVRKEAGMFDVSHMTVVDICGEQAKPFLRKLLANDVAKLKKSGKALYSCMLNDNGGVIDDLLVYFINEQHYRLVVNAGTTAKDLAWLEEQAVAFGVSIKARCDLSIIAVQGPQAISKTLSVLTPEQAQAAQALKSFTAAMLGDWTIARTGYTGEDGFEILLPHADTVTFWQALHAAGVHPCGLGARDTLRLEAGLNLYGQDMDETVTPLESNLAWTVSFADSERDFIGRKALEKQTVAEQLVGIVLLERGVPRRDQTVIVPDVGEGVITSGTFSPTCQQGIAMARLPMGFASHCEVKIRNKLVPAQIISMPFVKKGQAAFTIEGVSIT